MTRQLSDKDRKNREDFWRAIRGFKFTHHVTLIFRLTMLIIYAFFWWIPDLLLMYRPGYGIWLWVVLPALIGLGMSLFGRFRYQSSAYVVLMVWDLVNIALIIAMIFNRNGRHGYGEGGLGLALLIYVALLTAGLVIGACLSILSMLLLVMSLKKVRRTALEVWESEWSAIEDSPSDSLYLLIQGLEVSPNLEDKPRNQRLVYKSFYMLTKYLLLLGLIVLSALQALAEIKEFKAMPLVLFALVFTAQLVLLSEHFGRKSAAILVGVVVSDALYALHLFVHFVFSWMNFVYVKLQNTKSLMFYFKVLFPATLLGLGLLSLTFSWLWWRSYRKSQQDIAVTEEDKALES
ncbi:hypothetical protein MK526_08015 [Abiotrophia defectiva]|uniref:hypothetical protein n=1 Tax=Abiotrophia defectiva TaxID=46125 RepID=UPI00227DA98C|nr:hypothetical protein [Abiotrophia defectiva]MCY7225690.1 hypothetical protein [Abiotrophia defectiva]